MRDREENKELPHFLMGESMGGMLTLLMHFEDPKGWDGIILLAPLITDGSAMAVPWPFMMGFKLLSPLIGTWQVNVGSGIVGIRAIRDPVKRDVIFKNPRRYAAPPRVKTRLEVERLCHFLGQNLERVSVPFLALHGKEDTITGPEGSQKLYEVAASKDKTLRLYEGAYHSLIQGELDETRDQVLRDLKAWLDLRSGTKGGVPLCLSASTVDASLQPVLTS